MSIWTALRPRQQTPDLTRPTTAREASEERIVHFVCEMTAWTCLQPDELHYQAWLNGAWARGLEIVLFPGINDSFIIHIDHVVARIQDLAAGPAHGDALRMGGIAIQFQVEQS